MAVTYLWQLAEKATTSGCVNFPDVASGAE